MKQHSELPAGDPPGGAKSDIVQAAKVPDQTDR